MKAIYISRDRITGYDEPKHAKYYIWSYRPVRVQTGDKITWMGKYPIGHGYFDDFERQRMGFLECLPGHCHKMLITVQAEPSKKKGAKK